jgi:hypothetical protein
VAGKCFQSHRDPPAIVPRREDAVLANDVGDQAPLDGEYLADIGASCGVAAAFAQRFRWNGHLASLVVALLRMNWPDPQSGTGLGEYCIEFRNWSMAKADAASRIARRRKTKGRKLSALLAKLVLCPDRGATVVSNKRIVEVLCFNEN